MKTAQETIQLSEERNHMGSGPVGVLDDLDIHIKSILASGALARIRDIQTTRHAESSISTGITKTEPEKIVQVDDMDPRMQSAASAVVSQPHM